MENLQLFISCAKHLEYFLKEELNELGINNMQETVAGISCEANLETTYKICLWSRVASRVFLKLSNFKLNKPDDLYLNTIKIKWDDHFEINNTFAIDSSVSNSIIKHSNFASLKVKDAIADYFNNKFGKRPSVNTIEPDIRFYIHIKDKEASLYIDLSGESLHKRSYRIMRTQAPLRENVAAAILYKARWKQIADQGGTFVDPMCGSGTLLVEAAMIAGDIAPGLLRTYFGFQEWKGHNAILWEKVRGEAISRKETGEKNIPQIFGSDIDEYAFEVTMDNIESAKLDHKITVTKSDFKKLNLDKIKSSTPGIIITNPPYGKRISNEEDAKLIFEDLGNWLTTNFKGWKAAVLAGDKEQSKYIGLRADKINTFYNGNIQCVLANFEIEEKNNFRKYTPEKKYEVLGEDNTKGMNEVVNRLKKNEKHIRKYLKKNNITCYRIYDADIPQYSAAIDIYENKYAVVQEYAPPATIDPKTAEHRLKEIIGAIPHVLPIEKENIYLKQRKKQKGTKQYRKLSSEKEFVVVHEGGLDFYANFSDYLDTGIFLDHRITREMIGEMAKDKTFLNLFAYTCTATLHAIKGGAARSVSVDTSNTYLEWGERNLKLNNFDTTKHITVRKDSIEYLKEDGEKFDLIFIDPPTFSNRKSAENIFDVQKDHIELIRLAEKRLRKRGKIIFSNNFRKFKMSEELEENFDIKDISLDTIPKDFERNNKIHKTWVIKRKG